MKTLLLILLPALFYAQNDVRYIKALNEIIDKYDKIEDDFYPDQNRYEPKDKLGFGSLWDSNLKKDIYPRMYMDGSIELVSRIAIMDHRDFHNIEKLALKIGNSVYELPVIDCIRDADHKEGLVTYALEVCTHDLPEDVFNKLGTTQDVKARLYGENSHYDVGARLDKWSRHWNFYSLMKKLGKFQIEK